MALRFPFTKNQDDTGRVVTYEQHIIEVTPDNYLDMAAKVINPVEADATFIFNFGVELPSDCFLIPSVNAINKNKAGDKLRIIARKVIGAVTYQIHVAPVTSAKLLFPANTPPTIDLSDSFPVTVLEFTHTGDAYAMTGSYINQ